MKYIITTLGLCLLIVTTLFFSDNTNGETQAQSSDSDNINGEIQVKLSDSDQGVTFTIDDYKKQDNNLSIFYTVTSDNKLEGDKPRQPFLDRPNFYVNKKFLNTSFSEDLKKISDYKYTGLISIRLKEVKQEHANFAFDINRISNNVGHWELNIGNIQDYPLTLRGMVIAISLYYVTKVI